MKSATQIFLRKTGIWHYLWIVVIAIFTIELAIMYVLGSIHFESSLVEGLVDSIVLISVMFPLLYVLMLKPLLNLQEELKSKNASFKTMIDVCRDGLLVVDSDGIVRYANAAVFELFNRSREEIIDQEFGFPVASQDTAEITILGRNTPERIASMRTTPSTWEGAPAVLASLHDITEHKFLLQETEILASHDDLTGLYNRRILEKFLEEELIRATRHKHPFSLLLLDIDHFKLVNDNHGHLAGDAVLIELSRILTQQVREIDRVCRYGGEEIILLLPETGIQDAFEIAERIRKVIASYNFDIRGRDAISITVSIGISSLPEQDADADQLIRAADMALYQAKENGRNMVCLASQID